MSGSGRVTSVIGRILGRGEGGGEAQGEPLHCYLCGQETGYRCSSCDQYICNKHTEVGTTMCVECAAKRTGMSV
jgi:hypothetical protein